MELTFFSKGLSRKEEMFFNDYVQQKIPTIENLLTKFADDATILRASIEKFEKHDAYVVEFYLGLPTKPLVSREASHEINKAVDLSKDRLVAQIKKHMALLRRDRPHKTIREEQKTPEIIPEGINIMS